MSGPVYRLLCTILLAASLMVCILAAFGLGAVIGQYRPGLAKPFSDWAFKAIIPLKQVYCDVEDVTQCGVAQADRPEVSCASFTNPNPRHAILLTFGQSNSANFGESRYNAGEAVTNFSLHDGKCYRTEDPLFGADGNGGSPWGRLGDRLIESGAFDRVLVVPFGIGGTTLREWTTGGRLHPRVEHAARELQQAGITPTHVLWHQGEDDARYRTPKKAYITMFTAMVDALRSYGVNAPVFPAVASICRDQGSDSIRAAQRDLPRSIAGVYPGADTDTLSDMNDRHDLCHFSEQGLDRHALLWEEVILEFERNRP